MICTEPVEVKERGTLCLQRLISLGHCHPAVVEAVQRQAARGMHYYGALNDTAVELVEKLVLLIPCADRLVFSTTGDGHRQQ